MDSFCVDKLALPARLRPSHGVVRADTLAVACDGARAAALMLQEARAQAQALLHAAAAEAADTLRREQQRVAEEAGALLHGLRAAQDRLLDGAGALAVDLAARAFARLVLEATPQQRISAALRRVREEAPQRLASALAFVHPEDLPLIADAPWELRADPGQARGTCRLEAASGEWRAAFELGAAALNDALLAQAALFERPGGTDGSDGSGGVDLEQS